MPVNYQQHRLAISKVATFKPIRTRNKIIEKYNNKSINILSILIKIMFFCYMANLTFTKNMTISNMTIDHFDIKIYHKGDIGLSNMEQIYSR